MLDIPLALAEVRYGRQFNINQSGKRPLLILHTCKTLFLTFPLVFRPEHQGFLSLPYKAIVGLQALAIGSFSYSPGLPSA